MITIPQRHKRTDDLL